MLILLHTSKTMRKTTSSADKVTTPIYINDAQKLVKYIRTMSVKETSKTMSISLKLAEKVHSQFVDWQSTRGFQMPAIDAFIGDIYSGLQVQTWSKDDRNYAQDTLCIISGLYGLLRPLDGVRPYRLEMGYRLPSESYQNLYRFWGDKLAKATESTELIIDLTSIEYGKAITPHMATSSIVRPKFMTTNSNDGRPVFVVVHAKIARGAFASWLIKNRITMKEQIVNFNELGYKYNKQLSTELEPVFVCEIFGGLGLSVRLT